MLAQRFAALLTLCVGCTDDFTVGRAPAPAPADAATTPAGDDASVDAGPTCESMKIALKAQHDIIAACTDKDSFCTNITTDECGCEVGMISARPSSAALSAYAGMVDDYKKAGCDRTCKGCRPTPGVGFTCDAALLQNPTGLCADPTVGY